MNPPDGRVDAIDAREGGATAGVAMDGVEPLHIHLLTQTLAREAYLLDTNRYEEWLALLDPGVRYLVPVPEWVRGRSGAEAVSGDGADALAFNYLDETYASLQLRVARLQTGLAHGETPPSMTARVVGAPFIERREDWQGAASLYLVVSSFTLHQTRHENRVDVFAGRREDEWSVIVEPVPRLLLRARTVHLIQRVLPRTFSSFF